MSVLRRKQELEAITFRLPVMLKREIEELRGKAETAGFDQPKRLRRRCGGCASRLKPNSMGDPGADARFKAVSMTRRTGNCNEKFHSRRRCYGASGSMQCGGAKRHGFGGWVRRAR